MQYANLAFAEIINRMSNKESAAASHEKNLIEIGQVKSFLRQIQKFSCKNNSEQQEMSGLVQAYTHTFQKDPPLEWLVKENTTFKEAILTLYSTRLSVLVTAIKFKLDTPDIHRDIANNEILKKKLEDAVSENKSYLNENIFPSKASIMSQIQNWGKNIFATSASSSSSDPQNTHTTNASYSESARGSNPSSTSNPNTPNNS